MSERLFFNATSITVPTYRDDRVYLEPIEEKSDDLEVLIVWKGKGHFQWQVVDGAEVLYQGEELGGTCKGDRNGSHEGYLKT